MFANTISKFVLIFKKTRLSSIQVYVVERGCFKFECLDRPLNMPMKGKKSFKFQAPLRKHVKITLE